MTHLCKCQGCIQLRIAWKGPIIFFFFPCIRLTSFLIHEEQHMQMKRYKFGYEIMKDVN